MGLIPSLPAHAGHRGCVRYPDPRGSDRRDRVLCRFRGVSGAVSGAGGQGYLNSSGVNPNQQLVTAEQACTLSLQADSFSQIIRRLGAYGQPDAAFRLLCRITADPASGAEVGRLCASIPSIPGQNEVERTLLLLASQHAIPKLPGLAVSDRVKQLF